MSRTASVESRIAHPFMSQTHNIFVLQIQRPRTKLQGHCPVWGSNPGRQLVNQWHDMGAYFAWEERHQSRGNMELGRWIQFRTVQEERKHGDAMASSVTTSSVI